MSPMNVHAKSLGIGVAIGAICIGAIFYVITSNQIIKSPSQSSTEAQGNNQKIQMPLLIDNASPVFGSKDAPITLVEFGDYQCFYCNRFFHTTEPDIVKNYVDTGKVKMIFKDYTIIGQDSINAAHAAHCAQEMGKFWEYHDVLYNHWTGENNGWASSQNLFEFAKQVGLDEKDFNTCMSEARHVAIIKGSVSDAKTLGLTGTPGFFIIGPDNSVTKLSGAQPYDVFEEIFKSQLQKVK